MDDPAFLESYLAEREAPCPGCGYNLRGLRGTSCPECSQALRLAVGLVEPRQGLWVLGLVGAACGAGFNALLLVYAALQAFSRRGIHAVPGEFILHNAVGGLAEGALLAFFIAAARRIRRWSAPARIGLALLAWLAVALNIVIFSAIVR
jgi:hypothetical protein